MTITLPLLRNAICLGLLLNLLPCQVAADDNLQATGQLLVQSGVDEQIRQFPKAMAFKIGQIYELGQCDEKSFTAINQAISKTINTTTMTNIVNQDIQQQLNADELQQLAAWYNSPLGKKISALELASSSEKAYAEMKNKGELLFASQKRLALVKEIDNTLHATDWAVNVELQSTIAMLGGLAQIQHKNITANLVQFASQLDEQKALLKPQVEKSIWLWYMYTYQKLSPQELQAYLTFLQQPNTRKFNSVALKSLSHAITVVVEDFIVSIENDSKAEKQSIDK